MNSEIFLMRALPAILAPCSARRSRRRQAALPAAPWKAGAGGGRGKASFLLRLFSCKAPRGALGLVVILAAANAMALCATESPMLGLDVNSDLAVSVQVAAGLLNGTAYERVYVYSPAYKHKLSELIWDIKNVAMFGGVASFKLYDLFRINLGGWRPLTKGNGSMSDYDWMTLRTSAWSDRSTSDVDVDRAYILDVNASIQFLNMEGFVLRGMLGYKRDDWKWADFAGSYVYSSNPDDPRGFRDVRGDFARKTGIVYRQTYDIPYIGAGAGYVTGGFSFDAYLRYSPFVHVEDVDEHLLRERRFKGTFDNGDYIALGARAAYTFGFGLFLLAAADCQLIAETTGDMDVSSEQGYSASFKDGASVELNATQFSFATGYRF